MGASHAGHMRERLDVLGEARAAVADAGLEEFRADPLVQTHAPRDFLDIGAESLADAGNFVDKADLGCQKRVRGVFDHLGRAYVGLDDGRLRLKVAVQPRHAVDGPRVRAAEHDAIRMAEVVDRGSLAQKFGVADDAEVRTRAIAGALQSRQHPVTSADRHGAFVDHNQAALGRRMLSEAVGGRFDLGHVGFAFDTGRRADAYECDFGGRESLVVVERKVQASSLDVLDDDLFQPRLVNRQLAAPEPLDFPRVDVDADDLVAQLCETGGCYQPNVVGPDYCDVGHWVAV